MATSSSNKAVSPSIKDNLKTLKELLPAEDILSYSFSTLDGVECAILYADGMVNKQLLGDLVVRPLSRLSLEESLKNGENEGSREAFYKKTVQENAQFPELKEAKDYLDGVTQVLDGNTLLLVDKLPFLFVVGAKLLPVRAIMEPPTDVAIKGPREGFIEDIKVNMALVRKRFKTPNLLFENFMIGKQSNTMISVCYLKGTTPQKLVDELLNKIKGIDVDILPDSSYVATLISPRKHSLFKQLSTTEKPDIFCAKIAEGRVGILVDGSPIALTAPYFLTEDFQASEDYFTSPFSATVLRFIRAAAFLVSILLPGVYVSTQLFKMQLLPLGLMLTVSSGSQGLPLSPSMEVFLILLIFEVLKEASVRMPKYVGMSLSVVGALVLGEAAVSAGFVSTPSIIIVAFSGICLYTVPNLVETGSILRWIFLVVGGSLGIFGIVLLSALTLYYLVSADAFGAPLLSPFAPINAHDMKDSLLKLNIRSLKTRPKTLKSKNKTRLKPKEDEE